MPILTSLIVRLNAQPEITNGNFEVWDYYNTWSLDPQGWHTPNGQLITPVIQEANAYEGQWAMRVNVLPGFEGGVPQSAYQDLVMNEIPASLHFAVKANIPDEVEDDRVSVVLLVYNNGILASEQQWVSFESIDEWSFVDWELSDAGLACTSARLYVTAGFTNGLFGGSWDTWVAVDAMVFEVSNDISPTHIAEACLFWPNPANTELQLDVYGLSSNALIQFTNSAGQVYITDAASSGRFDCSALPCGIYTVWVLRPHRLKLHNKLVISR